jgi:hypothetical protein
MRFGELYNDSMMGSQRVIEKFLWFPVTIDYQTRWLEKAKIRQICVTANKEYSASGYKWQNHEWVDDEKNQRTGLCF